MALAAGAGRNLATGIKAGARYAILWLADPPEDGEAAEQTADLRDRIADLWATILVADFRARQA